MDQLWCFFYTYAKEPQYDLQQQSGMLISHVCQLLRTLYTHGVDWTDPSAWPEDYVDGHWERQIPIPFLLENLRPGAFSTTAIIDAMCKGKFHCPVLIHPDSYAQIL